MVLEKLSEVRGAEGSSGLYEGLLGHSLRLLDLPLPHPGRKEIVIQIEACGVCRTELDQVEGRISPPKLPVVPGHQPVGRVSAVGVDTTRFQVDDRVGAGWLYAACGCCVFCRRGDENLCVDFQATGCHVDGGYAEFMAIPEKFAYKIPDHCGDLVKIAPLMCAGMVGYRSLKLSGITDGETLGLYGFGSAHHLVLQMANFLFPTSKKYVFSRNPVERDLALKLGADWVGDIDATPPHALDRAIDTTPAWKPVIHALKNLERGINP